VNVPALIERKLAAQAHVDNDTNLPEVNTSIVAFAFDQVVKGQWLAVLLNDMMLMADAWLSTDSNKSSSFKIGFIIETSHAFQESYVLTTKINSHDNRWLWMYP